MFEDRDETILVVEDSATMRRIIVGLLDRLGFREVDEAENGQEGFDMACKKRYSIIISDWDMGPVDGLEFLSKLKAREEMKDIPFIMISSISRAEDVVRAKAAGVNAYIVKPFDAETLLQRIDGAVGLNA